MWINLACSGGSSLKEFIEPCFLLVETYSQIFAMLDLINKDYTLSILEGIFFMRSKLLADSNNTKMN
jgi:hypothetical protein